MHFEPAFSHIKIHEKLHLILLKVIHAELKLKAEISQQKLDF